MFKKVLDVPKVKLMTADEIAKEIEYQTFVANQRIMTLLLADLWELNKNEGAKEHEKERF
ncbi:hypothetical protein ACK8P5_26635 (plasmid) [Paenibacillus sp. EC2-1]|uniref:hypothetical protein n=1 Tax=Paenibacillus sp. EC2-1 TaxID=3388665 RepID=UPI003BEF410B